MREFASLALSRSASAVDQNAVDQNAADQNAADQNAVEAAMSESSSRGNNVQAASQEGPASGPVARGQGRISSRDLFRDGREIMIDHEGETYRLRLTKNGKLILTK